MAQKTLDLHGMRAEEVVPKLDRFMIQANDAELDFVRIMTGKGTGVVKKLTTDYLRQARYSWKYEKSPSGKDNEGVLIVYL